MRTIPRDFAIVACLFALPSLQSVASDKAILLQLNGLNVTDADYSTVCEPFLSWVRACSSRRIDAEVEMIVRRSGKETVVVDQLMRLIVDPKANNVHFTLLDLVSEIDTKPANSESIESTIIPDDHGDDDQIESRPPSTEPELFKIGPRRGFRYDPSTGNSQTVGSSLLVSGAGTFRREFPSDSGWLQIPQSAAARKAGFIDLRYMFFTYASSLAITVNRTIGAPKILSTRPSRLTFFEDGTIEALWLFSEGRNVVVVSFDAAQGLMPTELRSHRIALGTAFDPNDPEHLLNVGDFGKKNAENYAAWKKSDAGWTLDSLIMNYTSPFEIPGKGISIEAEARFRLLPGMVAPAVFEPNIINIEIPEPLREEK